MKVIVKEDPAESAEQSYNKSNVSNLCIYVLLISVYFDYSNIL